MTNNGLTVYSTWSRSRCIGPACRIVGGSPAGSRHTIAASTPRSFRSDGAPRPETVRSGDGSPENVRVRQVARVPLDVSAGARWHGDRSAAHSAQPDGAS
ncbi:hypothetical protein GCM10010346_65990 [Streptomyces chryseus]|uniref:Uncharacterized protein n=1 Tax=Streptomyces chryseus TaxID=68186 RepID=A0ABQ3EG00_9ACTN|nr:hypothetical protein GCM10010346_65990 [Streptomyces chryseus]